ncbi:MAG: tryptophan synthase subunit alpha, partial [Verrucomicrobia bacterium]|nr:tryptophan synthase subunit alpha [Verrucomicrobiota bacterium]
MNVPGERLDRTFVALKQEGRKGLVGYLTAGDPDMAASERSIRTAIESGLDVLELGVPFSDPTADGTTIQAASQRALAAGTTLKAVLALVSRLRTDYTIPIILFGYANPFFVYGYEAFCADAAAAGADGLLIVDLPYEETGELRPQAEAHGLSLIPLVAPTTGLARARELVSSASGFIYYIMVTGVTGERQAVST